ncbi:hypothetical protein [Desulfosoma caldarium]|uniref:hypothetical protein n=1 Tax=Desulfosoma caldarium TaxID=610254 RepID=UPI001FEC5E1E|nr:hypothetical protein [Desulfosoma caldarium]
MKIAYLIVAYNKPRHFPRLIRALETPNCAFFVHIDRKYNIPPIPRSQSPTSSFPNIGFRSTGATSAS